MTRDVRYALRRLAEEPLQSLAVILTLALGIGLNSAIFSVVHAAVVQPVAYPDVEELVYVQATRRGDRFGLAPADFLTWREQTSSFAHFGAFTGFGTLNLTGTGEPESLRCKYVTAAFFAALGIEAARGRTFLSAEEEPGRDRVVVLSRGLWQRLFGSDPAIVGRSVTLDGEGYKVIGVMPAGFGAPGGRADLWAPLAFGHHRGADRHGSYLGVIARLAAGVDLAEARAELAVVAGRVAEQFPETNTGLSASVVPLAESMTRAIRPTVRLLVTAVGFVLLIACVNVSNLLLARGVARRQEFAVRAALGAGRGRLLRQLLAESLLLSLLGAACGLVLAWIGIELLPDLRGTYIFHHTEVALNLPVFAATLGVTVAVGVLVVLLPALQASRQDPAQWLQAGRGAMKGGRAQGPQSVLVVGEVALAALLLVSAGLLIRSVHHLKSAERGFETAKVLKAELALPVSRYPEGTDVVAFYERLLERLASVPGVAAASAVNGLPGGGWSFGARPEGGDEDQKVGARFLLPTPGYFATTGIPTLRGRSFTSLDRSGRPPVMILNESAANRLFAGRDPIGKKVTFDGPEDWHEVVGVVGDVTDPAAEEPKPACYVPFYQQPTTMGTVGEGSMNVLLRAAGDPRALVSVLRREVWALDPDLPVSKLATVKQELAEGSFRPRLNTLLLTVFAGLALVLAAVGTLGLMAYTVNQRVREIGIRMALGAERSDVVVWILRRGLGLTAAGLALGLVASVGARSLIASFIHGVGPLDPPTYLAVVLLLGAVACATCYLPARRAAGVDPAASLRAE